MFFKVAIGAVGIGAAIGSEVFAVTGGFDSSGKAMHHPDNRVASTGTGKITEAEAQTAAKKRAFRSGVLYTSPTGLDTDTPTSSAKLR